MDPTPTISSTPLTTGQVARLLGTTEPRLSELVRRRKVVPPPPIVSGRRMWNHDHVRQAARALGLADPVLDDEHGCVAVVG